MTRANAGLVSEGVTLASDDLVEAISAFREKRTSCQVDGLQHALAPPRPGKAPTLEQLREHFRPLIADDTLPRAL